MKTKPMIQQKEARRRLRKNPDFYALGCEQGTGKTWMLLDDIEYQYSKAIINAVVVIAPNGVHTNWILREIPEHFSLAPEVGVWKSGAGKRYTKELNKLLEPPRGQLRFFTMNIDAVNTPKGLTFLKDFLKINSCMMIIDESSDIKSITSNRTKAMIKVARFAKTRRIASGTMVGNAPGDLFTQFEFLSPGGGLLGTTSYRSFVAEFSELESNPYVMRNIIKRMISPQRFEKLMLLYKAASMIDEDLDLVKFAAQKLKGFYAPQIVKRGDDGMPVYKNLEKLSKLMAPYTYRVLKKDCLDLPDKIYKIVPFDLLPEQIKVYDEADLDLRYMKDEGELDTFTALTKIIKVRQIVSGFIMVDGVPTSLISNDKNPRMIALKETLKFLTGSFIIWASFKEEFKLIAALMDELKISCVQYHGVIKKADRETAIDSFQSGKARCFLANPQSGGMGLTLTKAETALYYSSDYSLLKRLQSEDRCHRKGTKHNVVYIDFAAIGTIDEKIAVALQKKSDLAATILNHF